MQKQIYSKSVSVRILAAAMAMMMSLAIVLPAKAAPANAAAYAPVFDYIYYANCYPDLKAAFGANESALLNHFITNGMAEGRQGNAEFNVQYYMARYPDLRAVFGDNLPAYYMHYINCGKAEGRSGNGTADASTVPAGANVTTVPQQTVSSVTGPTAANASAEASEYAYQVLAIVNQQRAANGLSALSTTQALMNTAQQRAGETVISFSHTRPNGTSCFTAFSENGVSSGARGENIAAGQRSADAVMAAWMNSSGHRANILNPSFRHIGVGCYITNSGYGIYWTECFSD